MSFTGFSEEDLQRMKYAENGENNGPQEINPNIKKIYKLAPKSKRTVPQYKSAVLQSQASDDTFDSVTFDKCKLSLRSPTTATADDLMNNNNDNDNDVKTEELDVSNHEEIQHSDVDVVDEVTSSSRRTSDNIAPDVVRCLENYTEDDLFVHKVKLEELQLKQKLMEEQNKRRKEMLAKALADRTKQTEEEVQRLEKIKKELQVLDGQFSQDVGVLRKKIDQACLSYSEAEKHYLKVEKEFLQAKINLQKEKEKKELLTEHLCALITHNETRKAQKLETLMLELATDKQNGINEMTLPVGDTSLIIDGVDERTGKMVEMTPES